MINTGVRGYGTDQEYLTYLERGRALHPDLVVLHVDETDPNDNVTLHRMGKLFGTPAFRLGSDGSLSIVGSPVRSYPTCSSYHLDEQFHVSRIDSARERLFCWLETNLASRSALFSFAVTRIQQNRFLVRFFHNFGVPEDQQAAGPAAVTPKAELAVALARCPERARRHQAAAHGLPAAGLRAPAHLCAHRGARRGCPARRRPPGRPR